MSGRIAVHLGADNGCQRRIETAVRLAAKHQAELVGVYPVDVTPLLGYRGTVLPYEITQIIHKENQSNYDRIEQHFMDATKAAGIKAHWRTPKGPIDEALAQHARYSNLLVMSKTEDSQSTASPITTNLPETVIMAAGRPVLMVSAAGSGSTIGDRVLFCWDKRREAARAFADAALFLPAAKKLLVLTIDEDTEALQEQDIQENDFAELCTSLGYPAPEIVHKSSKGVGVGKVILNTASDHGSDLIVMGAYGHSRVREWIMGGASKTLLNAVTVPVLLSH